MVDLEPVPNGPFESASNVSFELLLLIGIGLFTAVSLLGRSPLTIAIVSCYLLAIPSYVAVRARLWEGSDDATNGEDDVPDDGRADDTESVGTTDGSDGSDIDNETGS